MTAQIPKCSILHTRHVIIENCKDAPEHCTRTYHISLPDVLCDGAGNSNRRRLQQNVRRGAEAELNSDENLFEGEYKKVGTIPMIFAFHGSGTDYQSMTGYSDNADDYNFVLVLPEGINKSFNAGDCCGDALELEIHDVDFLYQIQQQLSEEFDFLQSQYSYGIGWDNGGLLLTDASIESPHLFRAIVPIAGFSSRTWMPPSIGTGIGIMMHHSLDDLIMRPSGCCDDPNMPMCEGDIISKSCVSVLESFDLWARSVNLCTSDNKASDTDAGTLEVGGNNGTFYSVTQENGDTILAFVSIASEQGRASSTTLSISEIPLEITYKHDGIVCLTTASSSCVANSTLCLYKEMGHFEDLYSTNFVGDEVFEFLARDACDTNKGTWRSIPGRSFCECTGSGHEGVYCLNERRNEVVEDVSETLPEESLTELSRVEGSYNGIIGLALLIAAVILFLMKKLRPKQAFEPPGSTHEETEMLRLAPRRMSSMCLPQSMSPYRDQFYKVKTKLESSMPSRGRGRVSNNQKDMSQPSFRPADDFWADWDDRSQKSDRSGRSQKSAKSDHSRGLQSSLRRSELDLGEFGLDSSYRSQSSSCLDRSDRSYRSSGLDRSDRSQRSSLRTIDLDLSDRLDDYISRKSLDAIDKQLLQMYRKKSSGIVSEDMADDDHADDVDFDLELEQSYRRRKQRRVRDMNNSGHGSTCSSIRSNLSNVALEALLNSEVFKRVSTGSERDSQEGGRNDEHISQRTINPEYISSVLFDVGDID